MKEIDCSAKEWPRPPIHSDGATIDEEPRSVAWAEGGMCSEAAEELKGGVAGCRK
jgi:hypothetical protein